MIYDAPAAFEHAKRAIAMWGNVAEVTLAGARLTRTIFPWTGPALRPVEAAADTFAIAAQFFTNQPPGWNIDHTEIDGERVKVTIEAVAHRPYADTLYFRCEGKEGRDVPTLLVFAPWSGHPPDYVHDTIRTLLPHFHVCVTGWRDPRQVHVKHGQFGLDDKTRYSMEMIRDVKPDGIVSICEPCVSLMTAVAKMAELGDPDQPVAEVLMAGPIDPHIRPTSETQLILEKGVGWLERNVIHTVPGWNGYPGEGREVYLHDLQIAGFMAKKKKEHFDAAMRHVVNILKGDDEEATRHRKFYYRFLPGMPLHKRFFLDTGQINFVERALARNVMTYEGEWVDMRSNRKTAVMVVEGGKDDIAPKGQTEPALELSSNAPAKEYYCAENAGHTGVFSGSKWRDEIFPRVRNFLERHRMPNRGNGARLRLMAAQTAHVRGLAA